LAVDISGPNACADYAQQTVSGTVVLGGSSDLNLTFGSYIPNTNDEFTIIDAAAVSGTFSTNNLPAGWNVQYDYPNTGEVTLVYTGPGPGPGPSGPIELGSVADSRGGSGWTMDGFYLAALRSKLENTSNFGPGGTVTNVVNITDVTATIDQATLSAFNMFFIGYFPDGTFSVSELDAMFNWVNAGGTMLITADNNGYDAVAERFGFPVNQFGPSPHTVVVPSHPAFNGPFGTLTSFSGGGSMGAFSSLNGGTLLATSTSAGTNTMIEKTVGAGKVIVTGDVDMFSTYSSAISAGNAINNDNDAMVTNIVAYLGSGGTNATTALEFVVGEETSGPSNTVVVPVSVNNFAGITSFQGSISYDETVLTFQSSNSPNGTVPTTVGGPNGGSIQDGEITFGWADGSGTGQTLPDGTVIAELTFEVAATATEGQTDIEIGGLPVQLGYAVDPAATSFLTPTLDQGFVYVDATPPAVDASNIVSNNTTNTAFAKAGDVVTLTFDTDEPLGQAPTVTFTTGNGPQTVTATGSGTSWTATFTVAAGDDGLVAWEITMEDIYGNSTTTTSTTTATDNSSVTIDTVDPVISCPFTGLEEFDNAPGQCAGVVSWAAATATDLNLVGAPTQSAGPANGSSLNVDDVQTVTFTVSDAAGNTSTCSFDVVVRDTENPGLTVPAAATSYNNDAGVCGASVDLDALTSAVDNCTANPAITYAIGGTAITSPYAFPVGTTTVTATATDGAGLTDVETFDITVVDAEAPVLTVPAAATSYNNDAGVCEASVDLDALTSAVDNCTASPAITYAIGGTAITSPYAFPVGTTTVTATATDGVGLTDSETFDITVVDAEAPVLTVPATVSSYNNDPGDCSASVDLDALTSATDNCTANPTITYTVGGTVITSPHTFAVGTYTVTATAIDGAGLADVESFDVTVVDNENPVVITQPLTVQLGTDGTVTITGEDVDNDLTPSSDNCGIATYSVSPNTFDCNTIGANTVTLTVTDIHGNSASATAVVTVENNPVVDISGSALTMNGDPIDGTSFDLAGDQGPQTQQAAGANDYTFTLAPCSSNDIGASFVSQSNSGLDVTDILAIIKHTLLIEDLGNPYKLIAADVNNTDNINVLDAFQVAAGILGSLTDFTDPNTSAPATVAFVPGDYVFPDPNNPWTFPTRRFYTNPAPATGQDFTGIKLGDANGDWLGAARISAPVDSVYLVMDEAVAQPGELITIPVRVRDFAEVAGYQFTLNWDERVLTLEEVRNGALQALYNEDHAGKLASVWFDMAGMPITLQDDEIAFELVFRAANNWGAQTELTFSSDITPRKAYNGDDQPLNLLAEPVTIAVGAATSIDPQLAGYSLTQAVPNPFDQATKLVFELPQHEEVEVEIFNALGQSVRSFRGTYGAGQHELQWDGRSPSGAEVSQGMYYVRLRAGAFVSSLQVRKMN